MKVQFPRYIALWFILFMTFSASAFGWPFSSKSKPEVKSSVSAPSPQKAQSAPAVRERASSQEETFFEDEEEETTEAPVLPQLPQIPKTNFAEVPRIPQVKFPGVSKTAVSAPVSPSAGLDPDIVRIQKQIQEIMKINESLKTNFSGQAAEIQKISDQAKIHGEILKDLDSSRKVAEEASAEKYLNKEKLRLIKEETEKNQKYLQELNSQKNAAGTTSAKASDLIPGDSNKKV